MLLAEDDTGQHHVLKAFSGQITESWIIPGDASEPLPDVNRKQAAATVVAVRSTSMGPTLWTEHR